MERLQHTRDHFPRPLPHVARSLRRNPLITPKWLKGWLSKNEQALVDVTGARTDTLLGCGHWGCVFDTDDPRWAVKITVDPTEGALVQATLETREELEGGDGTGPSQVLDGIVFYKGLYDGGTVEAFRQLYTVYVIVREKIEPIDWESTHSLKWLVPRISIRESMLNLKLLADIMRTAQRRLFAQSTRKKRELYVRYIEAAEAIKKLPYLRRTLIELATDYGVLLTDIHAENVGRSVVDWSDKIRKYRPKGTVIIFDLGGRQGSKLSPHRTITPLIEEGISYA